MRNWDRGTSTCGTGTAVLGHAELGQFYSVKMGNIVVCVKVLFSCDVRCGCGCVRFKDMRNWDSGPGTGVTGTICLFFNFL